MILHLILYLCTSFLAHFLTYPLLSCLDSVILFSISVLISLRTVLLIHYYCAAVRELQTSHILRLPENVLGRHDKGNLFNHIKVRDFLVFTVNFPTKNQPFNIYPITQVEMPLRFNLDGTKQKPRSDSQGGRRITHFCVWYGKDSRGTSICGDRSGGIRGGEKEGGGVESCWGGSEKERNSYWKSVDQKDGCAHYLNQYCCMQSGTWMWEVE